MNILLWRAWKPLYEFPATFACLQQHSIGGTCSQLLWHARALVSMGHRVQVLGTCRENVLEEDVEFIGAADREAQEKTFKSRDLKNTDVVLLEGGCDAAPTIRRECPGAGIVHVGQNIDRYGANRAWSMEKYIDIYAFVSPGSMALESTLRPELMNKFMLMRNVVPWHWLYRDMEVLPVEEKVAWVGAWTKKGLRAWAETMARVLAEFPALRWELYGPSYGAHVGGIPQYVFDGLDLPMDRLLVREYPLPLLVKELATARVILVSLGNETACISALDGHAAGRPVLSGNDLVFKFNNPEGTGLRVFRKRERYEALRFLLLSPEICVEMGKCGRRFVESERAEANQADDLAKILGYLALLKRSSMVAGYAPPNRQEENMSYLREKVHRNLPSWGHRVKPNTVHLRRGL